MQRIDSLYDDAVREPISTTSCKAPEQISEACPEFNYDDPVLVLEVKWKNFSHLHTTFELDLNLKSLPSYCVVTKYKEKCT